MIRAIEFFSGIGGFAAAAPSFVEIATGFDIDQTCAAIHRLNFNRPIEVRSIESLSPTLISQAEADLWWMSPPCQPFTSQGNQKDLEDSRSAAFISLVNAIETLCPRLIALENVPGFESSQARSRLLEVLKQRKYRWTEIIICPSEFGIANRRHRYYLLASRDHVPCFDRNRMVDAVKPYSIQECLLDSQSVLSNQLFEFAAKHDLAERNLHVVDDDDSKAVTKCFTSAYGRSFGRSGSYLRQDEKVRPFAPIEIARLLGFNDNFQFPDGLNLESQWKRIGNSISVRIVRELLHQFLSPLN